MADTPPPPGALDRPRPAIGRRLFLAGTTGAAALLATRRVPGAWATPGAWPDNPFTLGVASGDPAPTGVVLWTRLASRPLDPGGGMPARAVPVDWEIAAGRAWPTSSAGAGSSPRRPSATPSTSRCTASTLAATPGTGSGPAAT